MGQWPASCVLSALPSCPVSSTCTSLSQGAFETGQPDQHSGGSGSGTQGGTPRSRGLLSLPCTGGDNPGQAEPCSLRWGSLGSQALSLPSPKPPSCQRPLESRSWGWGPPCPGSAAAVLSIAADVGGVLAGHISVGTESRAAAGEFQANAQLGTAPLSLTPPVQVTTTDAGNICRELIRSPRPLRTASSCAALLA